MIDQVPHGDVLELRLARPPVNALTPELIVGLRAALAEAQEGTGAVVLSGSPGMFSAGLDVPHLLGLGAEEIGELWRQLYGLLRDLATSAPPVIAAVTGHSPAGGAVMAIFCDRRMMAESPPDRTFRIGLNEVQVGLPMPPVIYRCLVRLVGPHRAEELTTEALMVSAEEALGIGLVDALAPADQVVPAAVEWCERLLALPRAAMQATRALGRSEVVAFFDAGEEELTQVAASWFSEETQAALAALVASLEKKG